MSEQNMTFKIVVALVAAVWSGSAIAQQHLDVSTIVQKQVVTENDDGERVVDLVAAETVVPGETVVYTIMFENVGEEAADNVVITNPINESLTYVAGSASNGSMRVEFSVDGGQTFGLASELRIVVDGVERMATTSDYTHVRWVMQSELAAGEKGIASFAAVLE